MLKADLDCGGSTTVVSALLPEQQPEQLHGGVVEEFLDRLPDSDRVWSSVAAAEVEPADGDCLRQHCPLLGDEATLLLVVGTVVVVVADGVVFATDRDEDADEACDAAATVVVGVLALVGATEPFGTTFDEVAVVVCFEELPSTTSWSQPAAVTAAAGAVTVRVAAAAASSLPASDCVELLPAAVVKDATVLVGPALMLPVSDSVGVTSCAGGGGVPAGDILDPAVCC